MCTSLCGTGVQRAAQQCQCSGGAAFVNNKCITVAPGTLLFGGNYQCFSKTSGNKEAGGVVATASEVIMILAQGAVDRNYEGPANIIYKTKTAANGKLLKDKIELWLNNFGLIDSANKRLSTYSGGMKRRVNLIAGVLHNPKILFLDEPTVGVDVQSRNVIIEHLNELNK